MIDWAGNWIEDEDYSKRTKDDWCDLDFMAVEIRRLHYEPRHGMENLIENILWHFDQEYPNYEIPEEKVGLTGVFHDVDDLLDYVSICGGLVEFDYTC